MLSNLLVNQSLRKFSIHKVIVFLNQDKNLSKFFWEGRKENKMRRKRRERTRRKRREKEKGNKKKSKPLPTDVLSFSPFILLLKLTNRF